MTFSPLANPSATLEVLKAHGLHAKKSLGQHFLVDDNVVGRILRLADLSPHDRVLEVGPGIGTLTIALCERVDGVVTVERDPALLAAVEEVRASCPPSSSGDVRLRVVHADALEVDADELLTPVGPPTALVANLPYNVAATLVLRFFEESSIEHATVMVQAEVADRMAAKPGGKDYGAYTVKLGLLAAHEGRFPVSRSSFLPPPNVDSAVIRLRRIRRPEPPHVLRAASSAADAAFAQRRKTLRNSMSSALGLSPEPLTAVAKSVGIDPARRGETLSVDEFVTLGEALLEAGLIR